MSKINKGILFLVNSSSLFFLTSCGDYKGASEPFSYAPATPNSIWIPPKCIRKEIAQLASAEDLESTDKKLTLAEVLDIALCNNPETKRTWSLAKTAAAEYGQAQQNYFVLSDLKSNYTNFQYPFSSGGSNTSAPNSGTNAGQPNIQNEQTQKRKNTFQGLYYGSQLHLSYTVLDFGQTRATSQAALASLYEADFTHNNQINVTINQVMNDYYSYLSQEARVKAAEQNVKNAEVALEAVLQRLSTGVADISDKIQATTKVLEEKLNLVNQKKGLTNSYTLLVSDMGFAANSYLTFESYPDKLQLFDILDLASLIEIARGKRPDLLASESAVNAKKEKLKLAQAQRYPVVTSNFEIGREHADRGIGGYFDYLFTVKLDFPLFQGYFIENGIRKAKAEVEFAKSNLAQTELTMIQEVTNYYNDVYYSKEAYGYAKQYLEAAKIDFRVNLEEYKAGTSTIVDLINAQTSVANAQYQLIDTEKQWYSSVANLSYSTGILTTKALDDIQPSEIEEIPQCEKKPEIIKTSL